MPRKKVEKKVLHTEPIIETYENIVTKTDANHIINECRSKLNIALVSSDKKGMISSGRTGKNCWIPHDHDPIFKKIAKKISKIVKIPLENAEAFQVIYYGKDQEYRQHHDSWAHDGSDKSKRCMRMGGQRMVTALVYLNDVEEGGETKFPILNIEVKPRVGRMLVFHNVYKGTNKKHPDSLHCGSQVITGEKFAFNLWFREENTKKIVYDPDPLPVSPPITPPVPPVPPVPQKVPEKNIKASEKVQVFKNFISEAERENILNNLSFTEKNTQWINIDPSLLKKLSVISKIDMDFFETPQAMRIVKNKSAHYDAFDSAKIERRGNRLHTMTICLNNSCKYLFRNGNTKDIQTNDLIIYDNFNSKTERDSGMQKYITLEEEGKEVILVHIFIREKTRCLTRSLKITEAVPEKKEEPVVDYKKDLDEFKSMVRKTNRVNPRGYKTLTFNPLKNFEDSMNTIRRLVESPVLKDKHEIINHENLAYSVNDVFQEDIMQIVNEYYDRSIESKIFAFGDRQSKRYKARDEVVSRYLHYEMLPLIESIYNTSLKPSYTYLSCYDKGSDLPAHSDNPQCEITVSFLLKRPKNEKWNIYLDKNKTKKCAGRSSYTPDKKDCIPLDFSTDENSLLCFEGQEHLHYREKLDSDFYNILLLHYQRI